MAISITTQPDEISYVGNQLLYRLTSDGVIITTGNPGVFGIETFGKILIAGETMRLSWDIYSILFTVVTTPDDSGTQIPEGSGSIEAYNISLAAALSKNFYLSNDFTITGNFDGLQFNAKKTGTIYTLSLVYTADKLVISTFSTPVNQVEKQNFKHFIELLKPTNKIFETHSYINAGLVSETDLSEVLAPYLKNTLPVANSGAVFRDINASTEYRIRYAESFGFDQIQIKAINQTGIRYAVNGGFDHLQFPKFASNRFTSFWDNRFIHPFFDASKAINFLIVKPDQPQWVYYLATQDISGNPLRVEIQVIYSDGSMETSGTATGVNPPLKGQVICVPVGPVQRGVFDLNPAITPVLYTVRVLAPSGVGGEPTLLAEKTLLLHYEPVKNQAVLVYRSATLGFFSLVVSGNRINSSQTKSTVSKKFLPYDHATQDGTEIEHDVLQRQKVRATTNYLTKADADWYDDFFASEEKYELTANGYVPIRLTSTEIKKYEERENLQALEFEFERLVEDEFATPFYNPMPVQNHDIEPDLLQAFDEAVAFIDYTNANGFSGELTLTELALQIANL